jgi:hypothetical protein
MQLPTDVFANSIGERKVYYFSNKQLNTTVEHYYVCLNRTKGDILILSCCTSKFETVKKFVEMRNLPYETLVHIKPKPNENPFTVDTYVNCNSYYQFTVEDFVNMYQSNNLTYKGEISLSDYEQLLYGLHASPLIDEDTKELLPNPEDIF